MILHYLAKFKGDCFDLFTGIGNCLTGTPFVVILGYYFCKRRNMVIAISQAVIGVGFFLASPLALVILNRFGLQGTFLILGGINAQLCVIAIICKPSSIERRLLDSKLSDTANQYKHETKGNFEEQTKFLSEDKDNGMNSTKEEMNEIRIHNKDGNDSHGNEIAQNETLSPSQAVKSCRNAFNDENKFVDMEYRDLLISEKFNNSGISSDTETEPAVVFEIQGTLDSPCSSGTLNHNGDQDLNTRKGKLVSLYLIQDIRFMMFLCSTMSWNFTLSICIMHLPNYMTLRQASMIEISAIMTCFTASNLAGRFIGKFCNNIILRSKQ